ncbi:MAG: CBS and ACT domain-containing protein [Truepera sp.]|nr:CBS and ACT domain-containing protein [Truepera sp.]
MLVGEWMTASPATVDGSTPVMEAMQLLGGVHYRRLPVVEDGSLVGIVTDRDLREASPKVTTLSIHELNYLLSKLLVRDVVKGPPITVNADDPVEWAALLMAENRVSGLPVLLAGELTGILTITDLLRAFVIALGLREGGTRVTVDLPDTPGTLALVAEAGPPSNIVSVTTGAVKPSRRRELILRVVGEGADAFATRLRERGVDVVDIRR